MGPEDECITHGMDKAVVTVLFCIQNSVFNEHRDRSQDEGHKQVHVDEVSGAVQLPVRQMIKEWNKLL